MIGSNAVVCFLLWTVFGLQHSLLARPNFKSLVRKVLGSKFEQHFYPFIYFLSQCVMFLIIYDLIRHLEPEIIFMDLSRSGSEIVYFVNRLANIFLILTVFHFDISSFMGLSQLISFFRKPGTSLLNATKLNSHYLYRLIRHPMYLGIILVYATSTTVYSELYFANLFSIILYIEVGSHFEEKTLIKRFGKCYLEYMKTTRKYIPWVR
jgi:methanethiol S-methyltransferase